MSEKKNKGGGCKPTIVLTEEQIKTASSLAGIGCNLDQIANVLGISRKTLDRRIKDTPVVKDSIEKGRSIAESKVLSTAFKMATSGKSPWMTGFWLKCKLGWKESKGEESTEQQQPKEFNLNYPERSTK